MPVYDHEKSIGFLMGDVSRLMKRAFDTRIKELGISTSQWIVLMQICRQDGLSQIELAERVEIEQSTLVRHLDNLHMQGLVERKPDRLDRRIKRVYLKDKNHPLIKALEVEAEEARAMMLDKVGDEELKNAMHVLRHIKINLLNYSMKVEKQNE
ncbi:MAG: MarR family transcriptional regulator [Alphaproteobacteria bacterium]|nr:MarR family transcriptional regulator [Alphaproteobacteria bacterium]